MKNSIRKWLSVLIPVALGGFLILYTYNKFTLTQLEEIKQQFRDADYFYIWISLCFGVISMVSRAFRWRYTLEPLGYKPKFSNSFMAVCIAYFMNMTIPRSGEVSRALVLKKYEDIPFDKGFGTIVAERMVDAFFLLFLIFLVFFIQYDVVKTFILDKISIKQLGILGILGMVLLLATFLFFRYSKAKIVRIIKQKISGFSEGFASIIKMKKKGAFFFHSFLIWFCYLFMFYITIFALPETSKLGFEAVMTAFVVGGIAITITNSGFGAYPFVISKILLVYHIAETSGNAFGWITWTSQTLMMVFLGTLSFLFLPLLNKNK